MHRLACAMLTALFAPSALSQSVIENFDRFPPQSIDIGQPLVLDHFRVEIPIAGRAAALRIAPIEDDLASAIVLGTGEGQPSATVFLYFDEPWRRVDLGIVLPPMHATPFAETIVLAYGDGEEHPWALGLKHSEAGLRQRFGFGAPHGRPIRKLMILLRDGAYVDNIELRKETPGAPTT